MSFADFPSVTFSFLSNSISLKIYFFCSKLNAIPSCLSSSKNLDYGRTSSDVRGGMLRGTYFVIHPYSENPGNKGVIL
jgi:hypothetical protein